jgi:hypothetical protein
MRFCYGSEKPLSEARANNTLASASKLQVPAIAVLVCVLAALTGCEVLTT